MIYYIFASFLIVLSFIELYVDNNKFKNAVLVIMSICMILLVGLRDGSIVGIDSPAYYRFYETELSSVEVGYSLLNNFFSSIHAPYNLFLIFINSISLYFIYKFIKQNSNFFIFSLFIYYSDLFFYLNFSAVRQSIAISIVISSYYFIYKGYKAKPIALILIASLFHVTALMGLLAFFIPKTKLTIKQFFKLAIPIIIGFSILSYIVPNVDYLNSKFNYYTSIQDSKDNMLSNYIIGIIKRSIPIIILPIVGKNFLKSNLNVFLFNIYLIGYIIYIATYLISPDFGVRFGSYFTVVECILLANYLFQAKIKSNRIILFLLFISLAIYKISSYAVIKEYEYVFFTNLI